MKTENVCLFFSYANVWCERACNGVEICARELGRAAKSLRRRFLAFSADQGLITSFMS